MKLPNGFGTVYKMQGNRRRPYVAKKTARVPPHARVHARLC